MAFLSAYVQASHDLVGHDANIYLAGHLFYNSSIKHTSCIKVSFWVSLRRARVGPALPGRLLYSLQPKN